MMEDEEEDAACPLCLEELDIADRNFFPCSCSYQICRFCWNRILSNLNGRCPACRQPYDRDNITFKPLDPEQIAKEQNEKKMRDKLKKQQEANSRKNLTNVRVIQRNLVYITNLPVSIAKEELLKTLPYFGQYGKILKVVVNKSRAYNVGHPNGPSYSAYVTFERQSDALVAIQCVDGFWIEGRSIRAAFGTTKYCSYFLRDMVCTNAECMYLHQLGGEADSFTKEDMTAGKHHFHDQIHPASQLPPSSLRTPVEGARTVFPAPSSIVGLRTSFDQISSSSETVEPPAVVDKGPPAGPPPTSSVNPPPPAPSSAATAASRTKKGRPTNTAPPADADATRSILPPTASWAGARNRGETPQRKENSSPEDPLDSSLSSSLSETKASQTDGEPPKEAISTDSHLHTPFPSLPPRTRDDVEVEDLGFDPWAEGAKGLGDFIESPPRVFSPDIDDHIGPSHSQSHPLSQESPPLSSSSAAPSTSPFPFSAEMLISKDVIDPRDFPDIPPGFLGATFNTPHTIPSNSTSVPSKTARSRFGFAQEEEGTASYSTYSQSATAPVSYESSASLPYQPEQAWSLDSASSLFASQSSSYGAHPPVHPEDYLPHPIGWVTSPSQIAPSPFGNWMIPGALGHETPPFLSAPSWNAEQFNTLFPPAYPGTLPDMNMKGGIGEDQADRGSRMIHISLSDEILHPASPRNDTSQFPSSTSSSSLKDDSAVHSMPFFDSAIISAGPFSRAIPPSEIPPTHFPVIDGKGKRDDADLRSLVGIPDRQPRVDVVDDALTGGKAQAHFQKNSYPKRGQAEHVPPSWHGQYPYPNNPEPSSYSNFSHSYHHHPSQPPPHHSHHSPHDQQALPSSVYPRNYPQQGRYHHRDQRKEYEDNRRNRSFSGNATQTNPTAFAPSRPPYAVNPQPYRAKHPFNKGYEQPRNVQQPIHPSPHHPFNNYSPQQTSLPPPSHHHPHHSPVLQSATPSVTPSATHSPQLLSSQPNSYPPPSASLHTHIPSLPSQSVHVPPTAEVEKPEEIKKVKQKKNARVPLTKGRGESESQKGKGMTTISYEVLQTDDDDVWESHDPSRVEIGSKSSWIDDSDSDETEKEAAEKEKVKETIDKKAPAAQSKEVKGKAGKATASSTDQTPSQKGEKQTSSSSSSNSSASQSSTSSASATSSRSQAAAVRSQPQKNQPPAKKPQPSKQKKGTPTPSPSQPQEKPTNSSSSSLSSSSSSVPPAPLSSLGTSASLSTSSVTSGSLQSSEPSVSLPAVKQIPKNQPNVKSEKEKIPTPSRSSPPPQPPKAVSRPPPPPSLSLRKLSPDEIAEISQEMKAFLDTMVTLPKPLLFPPPSSSPSYSLSTSFMPTEEESLNVSIPMDSILDLSERYSDYEIKCIEEHYNLEAAESQEHARNLHELAVEMKKLI